jgi:hypothetical protein
VEEEIQSFINGLDKSVHQLVVKPSGKRRRGSLGVSYHSRMESKSIVDAANELIQILDPGNSVLIEVICDLSEDDNKRKDLSFRVRANVCRGPHNKPITTTLFCSVVRKNHPNSDDNRALQSLESTLIQWGLEQETERIIETIKKGSENLLQSIIVYENGLTAAKKVASKHKQT